MTSNGGRPVLLIGGPTACGKSALAMAIAREFGGTIVNADAMQLYRAIPILTAQPTAEEQALRPHRLYGVLDPDEIGSAQRWRDMALTVIAECHAAGELPIVAGGTGLYLRTLLRGLSPIPDIPPEIRAAARQSWDEIGPEAFRARLGESDPDIVRRLKPGDRQRHLRAWEVFGATGRPLSQWQAEPGEGAPGDWRSTTMLMLPPRAGLRQAIERRLHAMVARGALEEVRRLLALDLPADRPIMKAVGVAALSAHLRGEIPLEQAIEQAVTATAQYAKRQYTWFRHQIIADYKIDEQFSQQLLPETFSFIRQNLLTPQD